MAFFSIRRDAPAIKGASSFPSARLQKNIAVLLMPGRRFAKVYYKNMPKGGMVMSKHGIYLELISEFL